MLPLATPLEAEAAVLEALEAAGEDKVAVAELLLEKAAAVEDAPTAGDAAAAIGGPV